MTHKFDVVSTTKIWNPLVSFSFFCNSTDVLKSSHLNYISHLNQAEMFHIYSNGDTLTVEYNFLDKLKICYPSNQYFEFAFVQQIFIRLFLFASVLGRPRSAWW